jgi:hypothetical protein
VERERERGGRCRREREERYWEGEGYIDGVGG